MAIIAVMTDPAPATPLTCLIVDDSPDFLEAASQLLAADGVTVVGTAATADQAVSKASARHPDVALVDVELGTTESGVDVAHRLGELPDGGPPVILISAESGGELAELVDAGGAIGFVTKTDLSGDAIRGLLGEERRS